LALIALGQAAGFRWTRSDDVHFGGAEHRPRHASALPTSQRMVKRLKAMIERFRHAAACPAPSHAACPSFRR
jgi:hypothetical protein